MKYEGEVFLCFVGKYVVSLFKLTFNTNLKKEYLKRQEKLKQDIL